MNNWVVKLGQANKVVVSNHCDLIFDLWTKLGLLLIDHIESIKNILTKWNRKVIDWIFIESFKVTWTNNYREVSVSWPNLERI